MNTHINEVSLLFVQYMTNGDHTKLKKSRKLLGGYNYEWLVNYMSKTTGFTDKKIKWNEGIHLRTGYHSRSQVFQSQQEFQNYINEVGISFVAECWGNIDNGEVGVE